LNSKGPNYLVANFGRVGASPGSRIVVARRCRCRWLTGFSLFPTVNWKLEMLHSASQPQGRSRCSHAPVNTPSLNGEELQCGVVVGHAPPRAPPQWGMRVLFVYDNNIGTHRIAKRTRWVVPTPTTGRLELSGSRQARGGSYSIPFAGGRQAPGDGGGACLRHARRRVWGWAHGVSPLGQKTTIMHFRSKSRNCRCMTSIRTKCNYIGALRVKPSRNGAPWRATAAGRKHLGALIYQRRCLDPWLANIFTTVNSQGVVAYSWFCSFSGEIHYVSRKHLSSQIKITLPLLRFLTIYTLDLISKSSGSKFFSKKLSFAKLF